MSRKYIYFL